LTTQYSLTNFIICAHAKRQQSKVSHNKQREDLSRRAAARGPAARRAQNNSQKSRDCHSRQKAGRRSLCSLKSRAGILEAHIKSGVRSQRETCYHHPCCNNPNGVCRARKSLTPRDVCAMRAGSERQPELERQHDADEDEEAEPRGHGAAHADVAAAKEHERGQLDLVVPRAAAVLLCIAVRARARAPARMRDQVRFRAQGLEPEPACKSSAWATCEWQSWPHTMQCMCSR